MKHNFGNNTVVFALGVLLAGSVGYVNAFSKGTCDGFLTAPS